MTEQKTLMGFTGKKVKIVVDYREVPSRVVHELEQLGVETEERQLNVGDFILSDRVGVERKSLAGDTPILAVVDGVPKLTQLDQLYQTWQNGKCISVLTMGFDYKIFPQQISEMTKHRSSDLYRMKTRKGNTTTLTGGHNVFSIKDGRVICKPTKELRKGDPVIVPTLEPIFSHWGGGKVTLDIVKASDVWRLRWKMPNQLELEEDLALLFGLFVAEGKGLSEKYTNHGLVISSEDPEIKQEINRATRRIFGREPGKGLAIGGVELAKTYSKLLNTKELPKAAAKQFPDNLFMADVKVIASSLRGYYSGDGYVTTRRSTPQVACTTKSKKLAIQLVYLLSICGIHGTLSTERKKVRESKYGRYYVVRISDRKSLEKFIDKIGFIQQKKMKKLADALKLTDGGIEKRTWDRIDVGGLLKELADNLAIRFNELGIHRPGDERGYTREEIMKFVQVAREKLQQLRSMGKDIENLRKIATGLKNLSHDVHKLRKYYGTATLAQETGVSRYTLKNISNTGYSPSNIFDFSKKFVSVPIAPDYIQLLAEIDWKDITEGLELLPRLGIEKKDVLGTTQSMWGRRIMYACEMLVSLYDKINFHAIEARLAGLELIANSDITVDYIEEVTPIKGEQWVYDISTPPHENFICGEIPTMFHNTTADFLQSIVDKRLLEQAERLSKTFERPVLILEGEGLYSWRAIHPNAIRGALASLVVDFGIPILPTRDEKETALVLAAIARREQVERVREVAIRGKQKRLTLPEQQRFVVEGLPGVSAVLAKRLLEHFGAVELIMNASEEQLQQVHGIGKEKAKRIKQVLISKYKKEDRV